MGVQKDKTAAALYGCMLYFENTLISSYRRTMPDSKRITHRKPRDRFGAVLICNLTKTQGFEVDAQKVKFESNAATDEFWPILRDHFDKYLYSLAVARAEKYPWCAQFRKLLDDVDRYLDGDYGFGQQGYMLGVRLPVRGDAAETDSKLQFDSYTDTIMDPLSLKEVRNRLDSGQYDSPTSKAALSRFRRDMETVFNKAIKWHSKGRYGVPSKSSMSHSILCILKLALLYTHTHTHTLTHTHTHTLSHTHTHSLSLSLSLSLSICVCLWRGDCVLFTWHGHILSPYSVTNLQYLYLFAFELVNIQVHC
jgi:hypothetical protein